MNRSEAEKIVAAVNRFWRERGYDAGAQVVIQPGSRDVEREYRIETKMVNGLPPGFSSAEKKADGVQTVPPRELKFGRAR